jgi:hypothetical protein
MHSSLRLHTEHTEYGWALRAIGQDLAELMPTDLEIEFTGRLYIARGQGRRSRSQPAEKPGALGRLLSKLKRGGGKELGAKVRTKSFERTYSLAKIHSLSEQGKSRRRYSPQQPDINVLGERLRAVGKMIESKRGQLIVLTMDDYRVTFKYRNSKGEVHEEEQTIPGLYRSHKANHPRRLAGKERCPWDKSRG